MLCPLDECHVHIKIMAGILKKIKDLQENALTNMYPGKQTYKICSYLYRCTGLANSAPTGDSGTSKKGLDMQFKNSLTFFCIATRMQETLIMTMK